MIDVENEVFNTVANALRAEYGDGISVYGIEVETPERFPSVSLIEDNNIEVMGNTTLTRDPERASELSYTAYMYSNLAQGKKEQVKNMLHIIDGAMRKMGFRRVSSPMELPNIDRTIYRGVISYTRIIQIFD